MADTFNQQLFDAMVRHQVGLLQFSGGVRNKVWKLLDATEADVRQQILEGLRLDAGKPLTPARLDRMNAILASLKETRLAAWKDVNATWFDEMKGLAVAEPKFMADSLTGIFPVDLGLELPDAARLRAIVTHNPFLGATLSQWAKGEAKGDIDRIHQQIKIGMAHGEDVQQMARRIVGTIDQQGANGVTAQTRRNAEAITRTATNGVASASRREFFDANADLMSGELYTATLDSRTTPICASLDGKIFPIGEGPQPPLHWNCRSVRSPVVDGEVIGDRPVRNFTEKQLLREYAAKKGIKAPATRDGLPRGAKGDYDAFARKRMRELTGTVPARTSYQEWLKAQSPQFQDDILGPTRGKLFRDGELPLDRFVSPTGKTLNLKELGEFDAAAFRDAGLEPGATARSIAQDTVEPPSGPKLSSSVQSKGQGQITPVDRGAMAGVLERMDLIEKKKGSDEIFFALSDLLDAFLEGRPTPKLDATIAKADKFLAKFDIKVPKSASKPIKLKESKPPKLPKPTDLSGAEMRAAILEDVSDSGFADLLTAYEEADAAYATALKQLDAGKKFPEGTLNKLYLASEKAERKFTARADELTEIVHDHLRVEKPITIKSTLDARVDKASAAKAKEASEFLASITSKSGRQDFEIHVDKLAAKERAYADPLAERIFLTKTDGTDIYVHEMGHILEAGPNSPVVKKAVAFLKKRAKLDKKGLQPLNKLLRGAGYEADEVAYRDDFIDPYMGKWYNDGEATEIVSMAVEMLYREPFKLMRKDPEMFDWIVDVLRGIR